MGLFPLDLRSYIRHLIDFSQRKNNVVFNGIQCGCILSVAMSTFVVTQIPTRLSAQQGCFGAP